MEKFIKFLSITVLFSFLLAAMLFFVSCDKEENGDTGDSVTYGSVTDVDGNRYKTIVINDQEWMAENLRTTHFDNGTAIPNVTDDNEWSNLSTAAYCWYDNDASYKDEYGAIYNWHAVGHPGGLCPQGWRVARNEDWNNLMFFLGAEGHDGKEGKALKTTSGWDTHSNGRDGNGTDKYHFSALPGGFRHGSSGMTVGAGTNAHFWSSSISDPAETAAWTRSIYNNVDNVRVNSTSHEVGYYVRCIKVP